MIRIAQFVGRTCTQDLMFYYGLRNHRILKLREGVHLQLDERRIGHSAQPLS
ncbi:hypothetical protein HWD31_gp41 [Pantoea phage vB_PagM_SSEM1]|uniref:Uncharacterized protein n=1 Tax=Pantoea phage vB_PagM_SSEM1 TaxID=2721760 RepID=A0A6H0D9I9_9CAUD|nr:hypothetical protein HWD31_gp41 [Pantoea phage vB_PagM_SSEM1]QIS79376.1 hypothetical protein SSEM1_gp41 [Pantoea phage vB_PagM_SSEM1]